MQCLKTGCNEEATVGSSYCQFHKPDSGIILKNRDDLMKDLDRTTVYAEGETKGGKGGKSGNENLI